MTKLEQLFNKPFSFFSKNREKMIDPELLKFYNQFCNDCVSNLDKLFNNRGFNQSVNLQKEYENIIYETIIKACENNYFLGKTLDLFSDRIDLEIKNQVKNLEKIDSKLAVHGVAADHLYQQFLNNEAQIGAKVVMQTYEDQIKEKLSPDLQEQKFIKETVSDTGYRFIYEEMVDGDLSGETLFKKLDSAVAMSVLTEIKQGLETDKLEIKNAVNEAFEKFTNSDDPDARITLEKGEAALQRSFIDEVKEVCQRRGLFFDYDNHKQHQTIKR